MTESSLIPRKDRMDNEPIAKWHWNQHWNRSIAEAIAELEREAGVRIRCFDRWISEGKVSRVDAWDRAERILSAIQILRTVETQQLTKEFDEHLGEYPKSIVPMAAA